MTSRNIITCGVVSISMANRRASAGKEHGEHVKTSELAIRVFVRPTGFPAHLEYGVCYLEPTVGYVKRS